MKLTAQHPFYVLLCKGANKPMICGVFSSRHEAQKLKDDPLLSQCVAKHVIKKCTVTVTI